MNKLYIDQQGIIKLVDVPEEPESPIRHMIVETEIEYEQALAAAKEAGITVADQSTTIDFLDSFTEVHRKPKPFDEIRKDVIINLPEGWRVEIADISSPDGCESEKVAVLLPPVSEKVENQEEKRYSFGQMINFVKWYSGMDETKVIAAYARYIRETEATSSSPAQ